MGKKESRKREDRKKTFTEEDCMVNKLDRIP